MIWKTCLNSRILSVYLPLRLPISPWWPTLHRHQWVYLGGQWLPVWLKSFISGNVLLLNLFFLGMIAKILLELSCVFVPMVFANWVPLMNVKILMNVLQITTNMKVEKVRYCIFYTVHSRFKKARFKKESRFKKDCWYNRFFST